ncbi:MAG: hypothetical protein VXY34_01880 [Bdellovibrionota bacterium]|nr:hypothetical protein [Bdellovibrionota bacterium]|tara:strand:+ start:902 stop:1210 length:309 start_codon:yes stop_codon:yes gene_type:complete
MDNNPNWSKKVMQVLQHAQEELKKTTEIGKKMISASKTSSELHEAYEELGKLVYKGLKGESLSLEDPRLGEFVEKIDDLQEELGDIESEVNKIKFSEKDKEG